MNDYHFLSNCYKAVISANVDRAKNGACEVKGALDVNFLA
jgi:hypothetical protein